MRNISITITVPHLFSSVSAFSAEIKSYIMRFNGYETLQTIQSNFSIFNHTFIRVHTNHICSLLSIDRIVFHNKYAR